MEKSKKINAMLKSSFSNFIYMYIFEGEEENLPQCNAIILNLRFDLKR